MIDHNLQFIFIINLFEVLLFVLIHGAFFLCKYPRNMDDFLLLTKVIVGDMTWRSIWRQSLNSAVVKHGLVLLAFGWVTSDHSGYL